MHVGVLLGTLMTGNVWFVIMPSQRELVNATKEGRAQDPAIGYQAKQRSIHNNYITFPLLFIMLSNHFPSTFGHKLNWVVLLVLAFGSALIRHFMNIRFTYRSVEGPRHARVLRACVATLIFFAHPAGSSAREQPIGAAHGGPGPTSRPSSSALRALPRHAAPPTPRSASPPTGSCSSASTRGLGGRTRTSSAW
jgi:uncharacterized membrane protein